MINEKISKLKGRVFLLAGPGTSRVLVIEDRCSVVKAICYMEYDEQGRVSQVGETIHVEKYGVVKREHLFRNITAAAEAYWLQAFDNYAWWLKEKAENHEKLSAKLNDLVDGFYTSSFLACADQLVKQAEAWDKLRGFFSTAKEQRDRLFRVMAKKYTPQWLGDRLKARFDTDECYKDLLDHLASKHNKAMLRKQRASAKGDQHDLQNQK